MFPKSLNGYFLLWANSGELKLYQKHRNGENTSEKKQTSKKKLLIVLSPR